MRGGARPLGVPALGAVTDLRKLWTQLGDPVLRRRARHVVTDSARARAIAAALYYADASGPLASTRAVYEFIGQSLAEGQALLPGRPRGLLAGGGRRRHGGRQPRARTGQK